MFGNTVGNSELGSPYQRASVQYEASFRENQIDRQNSAEADRRKT